MAESEPAQGAAAWPVPEFHFGVEISGAGRMSCEEVSGLAVESDEIEYRSGNMPGVAKVKMRGLKRGGEVTFRKAVFEDDKNLWDWLNQMMTNAVKRADVTITLMDGSGSPVQRWKLTRHGRRSTRWMGSRPTATACRWRP